MNNNKEELWGVIYLDAPVVEDCLPRLYGAVHNLSRLTSQQLLLLAYCDNNLFHITVNILVSRYIQAGSLPAWLSIWQDISAHGIILLDIDSLETGIDTLTLLAESHNNEMVMALERDKPFPAYYNRSAMGAGLRLWRRGTSDLGLVLKALKAPLLSDQTT